jgi:hypothetical protein
VILWSIGNEIGDLPDKEFAAQDSFDFIPGH